MNNIKYVGMDVHKSIIMIMVLNAAGQIESRTKVKTKAENMCDFFRGPSGRVEGVLPVNRLVSERAAGSRRSRWMGPGAPKAHGRFVFDKRRGAACAFDQESRARGADEILPRSDGLDAGDDVGEGEGPQ